MSFIESLQENIRYLFSPDLINKIQKPLDDFRYDNETLKKKTTEFGSMDDNDGLDIDGISASSYNTIFSLDSPDAHTMNDLIKKYRVISQISYVNDSIEEIVSESIFISELPSNPVSVTFNDPQSKLVNTLKERIGDEFDTLLDIMDFDDIGHDYFRQWYIDGRLLVQTILDKKDMTKGILGVKTMSPLNLKRNWDPNEKRHYYTYDRDVVKLEDGTEAIKTIPDELMVFLPSGLYEKDKKVPISYLHTAIKEVNRLDTLEDHFLIYRIVRSPERRAFYIDAGNLPPKKAEQYLKQVINTYKQKKVYNESDGTLSSKNQHASILEDFFLLRRNGKGTEIATLGDSAGGLETIEDLLYFQKKAARALHVPFGRMSSDDAQNTSTVMPTGNEITREELKFSKFITKLRMKFNKLFFELLKRQLIYKKIIKPEEWKSIRRKLTFVYKSDTQFAAAKRMKNIENQLAVLRDADEYVGKYFTRNDIYKQILGKTDAEVKLFEKRIEEEKQKYKEDDGDGGY